MSGWDVASWAALFDDDPTEDLREDNRQTMQYIQDRFIEQGPRLTGRFVSSLEPYIGASPNDEGMPPGQSSYSEPSHAEIDSVVNQWKPGDELGFVDNVPYAELLAEGHSTQASAGWVDVIVQDAGDHSEGKT